MPDITGDGINDFDITSAGSSTTIGGAIFTDAVNVGSGTGGYNTFLAISDNDGDESGFNSDDTPPIDGTNKDIDQAKTHTILLANLVVKTVVVNGVPTQFYEFRVDLNESNNDPSAQISLDAFKLFSSANGAIESTTNLFNPANANLEYDMDGGGNCSVLLSDAESSGSGTDDYSVLIPVSTFAGLNPATTFIYLYVEMGFADTVGEDTWGVNGTFEEWNIENGVTLSGTKFADLDGDGNKDAGEGPIAGVTIFIDQNQNGAFDVGERSTVTDANGNYSFFGVTLNQTVWIDEDMTSLPAGTVQTTGAHETVIIPSNATPGSTIVVDPIGNFVPAPGIHVEKDASGFGECADTVGEKITYTFTVTNTGNVALANIDLSDNFADNVHYVSGDTDGDSQLDISETWIYTGEHVVTQDDIDTNGGGDGILENTATVTGDSTFGGTEVTDDDDANVDVCQYPGIHVEKDASGFGDCADTVGEKITYTFTVTNTGNVSLENIQLSDDFADNVQYVSGDTDGDGELDVSETWIYSGEHTVTQDDIDNNGNYDSDADGTNDSIRNVATASGDAVATGDHVEDDDDAVVDVCQYPGIHVEKDASGYGDCADTVGEKITYTFTVTNTGNVSLENVQLSDDFADNVQYVSGDTDGDGELDVSETWIYSGEHTVTQDDIDNNGNYDSDADGTNDSILNTATASGDATTTGEHVEDDDDAVVDVCQYPGIHVEKDASGYGDCADTVGEKITYTFTVTNTGNVSLENVQLSDDFADNVQYVSGDTDGDGELDVSETWIYSGEHTVTQDDIDNNGNYDSDADGTNDSILNTATASGDATTTGENVEDDDDAVVDVCQYPGIHLEKDASVPGDCADEVGEKISYTFTVTNTGNVSLENVDLIDNFADNIQFTGGDTDGDGELDVDETWTYSGEHIVTQADIDSGGNYDSDADGTNDSILNTATASGDATTTGEHVEDDDDAVVEVCQTVGIHVEKDASGYGDCADTVGEKITYTFSVTNTGNVSLGNVQLSDDFADNVQYVSGDTDGDGELDVAETWIYSGEHTVTQDDIDNNGNYDSDADGTNDSIRNVATASGDAVSTGEHVEDDDDAVVDVCQYPGIHVEKDASGYGDCADEVGEKITYTFSVTNTGNVSLENVQLSDDFADNVQYVSGDTDGDGELDVSETWIYSGEHVVTQDDIDNNGNYDSDADGTNDSIRNVATASGDAVTTGDHVEDDDDAVVDVCQYPAIHVEKDASVPGDCADEVGEKVSYTFSVTNTGNVSLENVQLSDDFADNIQFTGGDTDGDGQLDVDETWTYTGEHIVTQDDLDNGGNYDTDADGIDDSIRNVATASGDAVTTGEHVEDDDDAVVEVCQNPGVDLTKYVDVGFGWDDANTGPGPNNVNIGGDVDFLITIENTGNVTLTDVVITDTYLSNGAPGTPNTLFENGALTAYATAHNASLSGDTDGDGNIDVDETWEITYTEAFDPLAFEPGAHLNTADVTDAQGAEDEDSAYYYSLVDDGLCPRTPGFWQNPKNGGQFWDGIANNEKHAGEAGFPDGELLYNVDSNHDGVINGSDAKGLLIGDYNYNGLTDAGEDTLFVAYADARTLINASNKDVGGDGRFMLGRDMVASWLNNLQGSGFGDASDPQSPHHYLDDAIDWMQIYSGTNSGGTTETFDKIKIAGGAVKPSTSIYKDVQSGFDHSASQMHSALDYYNNTGQTQPGGTHYANCESQHDIFAALAVYHEAHDLV